MWQKHISDAFSSTESMIAPEMEKLLGPRPYPGAHVDLIWFRALRCRSSDWKVRELCYFTLQTHVHKVLPLQKCIKCMNVLIRHSSLRSLLPVDFGGNEPADATTSDVPLSTQQSREDETCLRALFVFVCSLDESTRWQKLAYGIRIHFVRRKRWWCPEECYPRRNRRSPLTRWTH